MPIKAPKIDKRTTPQLVKQLEDLAVSYTAKYGAWLTSAQKPDAGGALIRIFSKMMTTIIERLNQVPDKNFLAFLDLIGTKMLPPRPARVPLTFNLVEGATNDAFVPKQTQVGASATESNPDEVVFETEDGLVVSTSSLIQVCVREPAVDTYSDYTLQATGKVDAPFPVFQARDRIEHSLLFANDDLLALSGLNKIDVTIYTAGGDAPRISTLNPEWFIWNGQAWQALAASLAGATANNLSASFAVQGPLQASVINGTSAGWMKFKLGRILPPTQISQKGLKITTVLSDQVPMDMSKPFHPFGLPGDATPNVFYIYIESVLGNVPDDLIRAGNMFLFLDFAITGNQPVDNPQLIWEYFEGGNAWMELGRVTHNSASVVPGSNLTDETLAFTKAGRVSFVLPNKRPNEKLHNLNGRWLRVRLNSGNYRPQINSLSAAFEWRLPQVTDIKLSIQAQTSGQLPEHAFLNDQAIDLSKDFFPFGANPKFNDTFYIKSDSVFGTPGMVVTLEVKPTQSPPVTPGTVNGVKIVWEAFDGTSWAQFGQIVKEGSAVKGSSTGIADDSSAFTVASLANIEFNTPSVIAKTTVNGELGYWIRARIVQGDYGTEAGGDLAPPILSSLKLSYTYKTSGKAKNCLRLHDFSYFDLGTSLANKSAFQPFLPTKNMQPGLYLGFDRAFSNRPITLYADVEPPGSGEVAAALKSGHKSKPVVIWEYYGDSGWKSLSAQDLTNAFSERGVIKFVGKTDFVDSLEFGKKLFWLRARWSEGSFRVPPKLRRLLTNTIWASQALGVTNEILGSGNGSPDLRFKTRQAPVLPGAIIEVREFDTPAADELELLKKHAGESAVRIIPDATGQPVEVWVRWQQVLDLYGSTSTDRHYILDNLSGEVRFGNGTNGMIPPIGRNNIRASFYRTSEGASGNRAAKTVAELKTTLPYIDSVINIFASGGGTNRESLERVRERGPKFLRHRQRAVTAKDIEDLALEASQDIARVLAVTPRFEPNDIQWQSIHEFEPDGAGKVVVKILRESENGETLEMCIFGPGQTVPYAQKQATGLKMDLSYSIPQKQLQPKGRWQVHLRNLAAHRVTSGTVTITYPTGSISRSLDLPAVNAHNLNSSGKVELILVPNTDNVRPTPNLGLVNLVEDYIRHRCPPTFELWITEPDWIEVTVEAEIVPESFDAADVLSGRVRESLYRLLHPLHGGYDGNGWAFGRRPYESDIITFIESLPGVDHVRSINVKSLPSLGEEGVDDITVARLPLEKRDRYLIHSGTHKVSIVT